MKLRAPIGRIAAALVTAAALSVPALQASAAPSEPAVPGQSALLGASGSTAPPDVSTTLASAYQTNNTVWALAVSNGIVYVGGQFTSVRPPGDAAGTGEVPRTFLAAFSASTGSLITTFDPAFTGGSGAEITALAVSGGILYVGGNFNHVTPTGGGTAVYRDNLAAFNLSTGALTSWAPTAFGTVLSIAPSPDGSTIYLGGDFNEVDGVARTFAGDVSASGNGTTALGWDPVLNNSVTSVAVAPDDSRVLVGGYFTTINGVTQNSIGSTKPADGTTEPWASTILPNNSSCVSNVKDIIVSGTTAYIAGEGTGGGCFDGDFAANISDGSLIWQNDCLGATQSLVIINGFLFKGSHAHDCAYAPGGFPQVNNNSGGWITHHLLDQSLTDGSLAHWTSDTSSPNGGLGPRVMATDGSQLFLGGDFTSVNGTNQQGFAIFPVGPDPQYPTHPSVAPTVTSTSAGVDSVSFPATSSRETGTLTYSLYRDSGTKPIATLTATSWPWALPVLQYRDTGLVPGSTHTYAYTASDGGLVTAKSPASAAVIVSASSPTLTYPQTVLADNPSLFWPLNESSGSVAHDASPNGNNGNYESGTTQGVAGPINDGTNTPTSDPATAFDGQSGNVTSATQSTGLQTFSVEAWFKSSANTGGKIVGFGDQQTGGNSSNNNASPGSSSYDRHIYMMNDGQIVFGVWTGQTDTIESPDVYNDGQWHYVVGTLGASGMTLYVDGQLVGTNPTTSAQVYNGYWRVGGDNLNGWNLDPWGSNSQGTTEPASYWFNGGIGDVAVYPTALSAAQVAAHYAANALSH